MRRSIWSSLVAAALLPAATVVASSAGGSSAAATGTFSFSRTDYLLTSYLTGLGSVAVGDLDGKNGPDLVAASYASDGNASAINVLLNNGDGTFAPAVAYDSCAGAREVVLGQFNAADSHLDVAVICGSQSIGRMLGDGAGALADVETVVVGYLGAGAGTGAWAASIETLRYGSLHGPGLVYGGYLAGLGALALCVLDVSQLEGDLDTATPTPPRCDAFQDPDPPYATHYEMSLGGDMVVGPFKPGYESAIGVGAPEEVNPSYGMASWVYGEDLNAATGYTSGWRSNGGANAAVALADVDNDTKPDVIMGGGSTSGLITDYVPGFPIVPGSQPTHSFTSVPNLYDLATGDFDADGTVDIAAMGQEANDNSGGVTVAIHRGLGDGTFAAYEGFAAMGDPTGGGASYNQTIAVADFNGDGLDDVATVGEADKHLTVLINTTPKAGPPPVLPATFAGSAALLSKKSLALDHYLLSNDARTLFGLKADGDLILVVNDVQVWHSDTAGLGVTSALMNKNGALQLLGAGGAVVWSSNTTKKNASLKVLDGRVVVTYGSKVQWTKGSAISALVAKGTNALTGGGTLKANRYLRSKAKTCVAAVINGELVLWGPGGHVRYRTGTAGSLATQLKLQTTGNLQLLTAAKAPVWSTNTVGKLSKLVVAPATTCELKLATKATTLFTAP